jgi:hypothetical protein
MLFAISNQQLFLTLPFCGNYGLKAASAAVARVRVQTTVRRHNGHAPATLVPPLQPFSIGRAAITETTCQNGSTWIRLPSSRTSDVPISLSCKSRVLTLATPVNSLSPGPGIMCIRVMVLPIHFLS